MKTTLAIFLFLLVPNIALAGPFTPPPEDVLHVVRAQNKPIHKKPVHHLVRHHWGSRLKSSIKWNKATIRPGVASIVYQRGGPAGIYDLNNWFAKNPPRQRRVWRGGRHGMFSWDLVNDPYRVCRWQHQGTNGVTVPWMSEGSAQHALCGVRITGYFHVAKYSVWHFVSHQDEAVTALSVDGRAVIHGGKGKFSQDSDVVDKSSTEKKGSLYLAAGWHRITYRILVLAKPRPKFADGRGSAYLTLSRKTQIYLPLPQWMKKPLDDADLLGGYDKTRGENIHLKATFWDAFQAPMSEVDGGSAIQDTKNF